MLGHTGQVCPTIIPTRHSGETSQGDTLHKAYVACSNFRGTNNICLLQLFKDSLHELYDKLYDLDAEHVT